MVKAATVGGDSDGGGTRGWGFGAWERNGGWETRSTTLVFVLWWLGFEPWLPVATTGRPRRSRVDEGGRRSGTKTMAGQRLEARRSEQAKVRVRLGRLGSGRFRRERFGEDGEECCCG